VREVLLISLPKENVNIPPLLVLRPNLIGPCPLLLFSDSGLNFNSSSGIETPFFLKTDVTFPWSICSVWKKDRKKEIGNENV